MAKANMLMLTKKVVIMKLFIGVDVSKNTLDICCNNKVITVSNNQIGLTKFYSLLQQEVKNGNEIAMVICEATGGYEKKLVKFSMAKNIPTHVAHANKVRSHAESKGLRAKTDKIDAHLLASGMRLIKKYFLKSRIATAPNHKNTYLDVANDIIKNEDK
jgi:transposase